MNLKNNILIVGGTGFIGFHLAKKSLKKGWQVTSISSKLPKKIRYLKKAEKTINWKPKILFKKGIKSTVKFYNEQAI